MIYSMYHQDANLEWIQTLNQKLEMFCNASVYVIWHIQIILVDVFSSANVFKTHTSTKLDF